jgi:hypothetical protein
MRCIDENTSEQGQPGSSRQACELVFLSLKFGGTTMSKVEELKTEIERLPQGEFTELFRWLSEKDWERWDKQIEADAEAGKLDFLMRDALEEKAKRTLKDL